MMPYTEAWRELPTTPLLRGWVNKGPCSSNNGVYYGQCSCSPSRSGVAIIEFFITTLRLVRSVANAWRRDPQFRSLVGLVVITLLGGTIFYSTVEGWTIVDAFYFSVTTLTTVGLGDLAPTTTDRKSVV